MQINISAKFEHDRFINAEDYPVQKFSRRTDRQTYGRVRTAKPCTCTAQYSINRILPYASLGINSLMQLLLTSNLMRPKRLKYTEDEIDKMCVLCTGLDCLLD